MLTIRNQFRRWFNDISGLTLNYFTSLFKILLNFHKIVINMYLMRKYF